ncbi:PQQ-binding-like beta-propeller repeat protein [Halobellus salinisoli]|uniref:outer membrane protein assembly factor BamB family protein n=1 Tax=Halobellus salinisoli TaxID=3108500 RepID=UPI00300A26B3
MTGTQPGSDARTDWPNRGFDARNSGYRSGDEASIEPEVAWEIHGQSSTADQPVVAATETVYFGSAADAGWNGDDDKFGVTAVDLRTDDVRWTYEADESVTSLATDGDAVFAGTGEQIIAVDGVSGSLRWRNESAVRRLTYPIVSQGTLFASVQTADDVGIVAIDTDTGTQSWEHTDVVPIEETSLAADERRVYANTMDGLYAFDRGSGDIAWLNTDHEGDYHTPAVGNGAVYLGDFEGDFCAFDASTGEKQWYSTHGGSYFNPIITDDAVITVGTDGVLRSHSPSTGSIQWSWGSEEDFQICSDPICVGETVFLNTAEEIHAINARTGQSRWQLGLESEFGGALAVASGRLLVTNPGLTAIGSEPASAATDGEAAGERSDSEAPVSATESGDARDAVSSAPPTSREPDLTDVSSPPRRSLSYDELEIRDPIGSGGQAVVSEAHIAGADAPEKVAVKEPLQQNETLDTAVVDAFIEEAETWKMLDDRERGKPRWEHSEHIVGVVDTGENLPWIAMEYMDGGSLADRLAEHPDGLPVDEALWIGECLCRGVELAHNYGIAHLDLKPENILFRETPDGSWDVPKLSDWGISRKLAEQTGTIEALSVACAAPEQFEPEAFGGPDMLTDVYQVGTLLYTVVTGDPPHTGSQLAIMRAVVDGEPPSPPSERRPELPTGLDRIVRKALAREKSDRYRTIGVLANELQSLRADGDTARSE